MRVGVSIFAATCALACPAAAKADAASDFLPPASGRAVELPPYLQCVPFARERSGVQIYGDALTWWDQAAGRYARGNSPRPGAVMAFRPSGAMVLGHVAAVAKVIDSRTVLLDHANWSPINGRRGQIERGVKAVDVSPDNDWSQVRVWYAPLGDLGTTAWPVAGFIYNERAKGAPFGGARTIASATYAPQTAVASKPSNRFADAFASLADTPASPKPVRMAVNAVAARPKARRPDDPFAAALAKYER